MLKVFCAFLKTAPFFVNSSTSAPWPLALISSDHINNNLFKFFLETDIKIAPVVTLSIFPTQFTFYIVLIFSHGLAALDQDQDKVS